MAQNVVQSSDALYIEDQIAYYATYSTSLTDDSLAGISGASWTNLGALSEFSRESAIETQQPPSQNVEHEQIISKMAENINITLQELNMTNYNVIMGSPAQAVTVAGTTSSTSESYAAAVISTSAEKLYLFTQQNWTTAVAPITPSSIIISGSSTYVLDQDYEILQGPNNYWGFVMFSTGAFTSTDTIALTYAFTPKSQSQLWHGGADELTPFMVKVYSIYADSRTVTTYYPRVEYVSGGSINDKAQGSGEYKDMGFTLQAREHPDYTYNSRKQFKIEVQTTA